MASKITPEDFAKFMHFMQSQQSNSSETTSSTTTEVTTELPEPKVKATPYERIEPEQDQNLEWDLKEKFLIEERSYSLASQSKFYEAISLLENVEYDDEPDIGIELLKAECYIQLGRETKAGKANKKIEIILTEPPICDVDDVLTLADGLIGNKTHIRALILLRIACNMFKVSTLPPDERMGGMFRCIRKMVDPVLEMIDPSDSSISEKPEADLMQNILRLMGGSGDDNVDLSSIVGHRKKTEKKNERIRVIALDYGSEVMEDMLRDLRDVNGADPENKAVKYAILANAIGKHYSAASQHTKVMKVLNGAIDIMENQFGRRADQHRIYSTLLRNMGAELHNSEKFQASIDFGARALEAIENAHDFNDENERRMDIRRTRESIRISQNHLKLA